MTSGGRCHSYNLILFQQNKGGCRGSHCSPGPGLAWGAQQGAWSSAYVCCTAPRADGASPAQGTCDWAQQSLEGETLLTLQDYCQSKRGVLRCHPCGILSFMHCN